MVIKTPQGLWFLAELLTRIPRSDAISILDTVWTNIQFYPDFISAALFINGKRYHTRIIEKVNENVNNIDIFEPLERYLSDTLHNQFHVITMHQLEGFETFLEYFNGVVLKSVLDSALKIDALIWIDSQLASLKPKISVLTLRETNGQFWSEQVIGNLRYLYPTVKHAADELTNQIDKSPCCELCGAQFWIWSRSSEKDIRRFGLNLIHSRMD